MAAKGATRGVSVPGYEPRYCSDLVDFMGRGYSLTAFAGEIGVSRAILERWAEDHPPFSIAVERGQARRARVLEDRLLAAKGGQAVGRPNEAGQTPPPQDWRREGRGKAKPAPHVAPAARLDLPDNGRD